MRKSVVIGLLLCSLFSSPFFHRYTIRAEEASTTATFTIVGILEKDDPAANSFGANLKLKDEASGSYFFFSSEAMNSLVGKRVEFTLAGDVHNYSVVSRKVVEAGATTTTTTTTSTTGTKTDECLYEGQSYKLHATFWAKDGCNTCVCLANGSTVCTQKSCNTTATTTTTTTKTTTKTKETALTVSQLVEKYCQGPIDVIFTTKDYIKVMSYINGYGANYYHNNGTNIYCPPSNDTATCQSLAKLQILNRIECRDFVNSTTIKESDIDKLSDLSKIGVKLFYTIRYYLPRGFDIYALIVNGSVSADNITKIKDNVICQQQVNDCVKSCATAGSYCDRNYCERMRVSCLEDRVDLRNPPANVWTREKMLAARQAKTASGTTLNTTPTTPTVSDDDKTAVTKFITDYFAAITAGQFEDLKSNYWCSVTDEDIRSVCVRTNSSRTGASVWQTCASYNLANFKIGDIKIYGNGFLVPVTIDGLRLMNETAPYTRTLYIQKPNGKFCTNNWYLFQSDMWVRTLK